MGCNQSIKHNIVCGVNANELSSATQLSIDSRKNRIYDDNFNKRLSSSNPQDGEDDILESIRAHYIQDSVKYDLDASQNLSDDTNQQNKSFLESKSFDKVFQIGEYLILKGEDTRRMSFNPNQDILKSRNSLRGRTQSPSEINHEFIRQSFSKDQNDFNSKLKQGPSQIHRWICWKTKLLNGNEFEEFFKLSRDNFYEYLLCPFLNDQEDSTFHDDNLFMIRKDTSRTFPEFPYFEKIGKNQLERSLLASSNFFRNSGYCQGMNFILGMLLLVSGGDEAGSFSSFISLSFRKEFLLVGLYENGFPLLRLLELIFDEIFREHLPNLFKYFKAQEVINQTWLTKWLMTLYLYSFPLPSCVRIVDYMISSNVFSLVKIAVCILKQLEPFLIKMDHIQISELFSSRSPDDVEDENKKILEQIDFEQVINQASKIKYTDPQIRQAAEECKLLTSREYQELFENLNTNENDFESTLQGFTCELNNILFFVEFFAQMGRQELQLKYLEKIKTKYISSKVPIKQQ